MFLSNEVNCKDKISRTWGPRWSPCSRCWDMNWTNIDTEGLNKRQLWLCFCRCRARRVFRGLLDRRILSSGKPKSTLRLIFANERWLAVSLQVIKIVSALHSTSACTYPPLLRHTIPNYKSVQLKAHLILPTHFDHHQLLSVPTLLYSRCHVLHWIPQT